jgi:tRNA pseudouridine13 synthase
MTGADDSPHLLPVRALTPDIPPVGGIIRERPEDFIVDEVPLYDPAGHGEHIYLYLQKYNLSTSALVSIVARHFDIPERHIGYAGLKDRRAVTRQVLSIYAPAKRPEDFPSLQHEHVKVLWADLHTNKLRRGHLRANRFAIKIRRTPIRNVLNAKRVLDVLASRGLPNRFGEQRFGYLLNNHLIGRAVLLGDYAGAVHELLRSQPLPAGVSTPTPQPPPDEHERLARELYDKGDLAQAAKIMPRYMDTERRVLQALARGADPARAFAAAPGVQRLFFLSAWQSAAFNHALDARLQDDTWDKLLEGDLAFKHDNGAVFPVDSATLADPETAPRLAALEISPSAPLWAAGVARATGQPGAIELAALEASGLSEAALAAYGARVQDADARDHLEGKRRPLRVPLAYPEVEAGSDEHGLYIRVSFELPPGAFATSVLREIMKPELAQ